MASSFPPAREAELITWSGTFGTKITATPTAFGLTAGQATAYATLRSAFVSAYNVAQDEATRSPMNISLKNVAKANLVANIRLLGGIVQRFPGTTNPMRIDLGLPPRDPEPTPVPPPSTAPLIEIKSVSGRTVILRLIDVANPTRRGRPAGAIGAAMFSHVGATAPGDLGDWKFEGNIGLTTTVVQFPSDVAAGATVWFTAFWFNNRKKSGPATAPISTNLPGGSVSVTA